MFENPKGLRTFSSFPGDGRTVSSSARSLMLRTGVWNKRVRPARGANKLTTCFRILIRDKIFPKYQNPYHPFLLLHPVFVAFS